MEYSCIPINNDVREYKISRKDRSLITYFDLFLLFTFICTFVKHQFYSQSLFKSFSTYFLFALILFRFYLKFFIVKEESLIVMREIGVQLKRKYFLRPSTVVEFIEKSKIEQIVINEGITKHNVIFYMAFIVEGKNKMVLAFEELIPRIDTLLKIYKGTQSLIFNNPTTTTTNTTATTTTNTTPSISSPTNQTPNNITTPTLTQVNQNNNNNNNNNNSFHTSTTMSSAIDDSEDFNLK
ncbi:hypothetical protein DDB_G0277289 [Dictyostelium discoideum AX4]|uniref:Phosphatidylinositol N-acetylglucosaminyltransferase subunit H conserved domain-containing protein n=1 Tax=Dictyostelium discoideum TaxID=44689 RepID=Q86K35_DICDI|nr:hypothetical protein DDB_G0277289 [Dictyostelium discoideum AX4]EAS66909.1 hypothetical protein DDB_G0277289 [Dictyostelium discoideum AX4]|eukprot:XP_001134593.1 hypothetical protein DDB_G0277289 [Dictyostelium discoideum AX4]